MPSFLQHSGHRDHSRSSQGSHSKLHFRTLKRSSSELGKEPNTISNGLHPSSNGLQPNELTFDEIGVLGSLRGRMSSGGLCHLGLGSTGFGERRGRREASSDILAMHKTRATSAPPKSRSHYEKNEECKNTAKCKSMNRAL